MSIYPLRFQNSKAGRRINTSRPTGICFNPECGYVVFKSNVLLYQGFSALAAWETLRNQPLGTFNTAKYCVGA